MAARKPQRGKRLYLIVTSSSHIGACSFFFHEAREACFRTLIRSNLRSLFHVIFLLVIVDRDLSIKGNHSKFLSIFSC